MAIQSEMGLLLVVARREVGLMAAKQPGCLRAAARDVVALERVVAVLAEIKEREAYELADAAALGATIEACAHMLGVALARVEVLRARDTGETRVERYLGEL